MKVKLKNNQEAYMVPKDGIVNVIKENSDSFMGEYFDPKRDRIEIVRVRKDNCIILK